MDSRENPQTAIPAHIESLFQKAIAQDLYPQDLYPRHLFPGLESVLRGLFQDEWDRNPGFRSGLAAADEARAAEMIAAALGLPAVLVCHPRVLVTIYQPLITGFIQRLHRRREESQDIVQEILTRLLAGKLAKIQRNFDANFKQTPSFTSYFMVCVRNMYVDIVREGGNLLMKRDDVPLRVLEREPIGRQACPTAFLDEEFAKLRIILQLHPASQARIVLCLKLKCRCAVTDADIRHCFPSCSADDLLRLRADFRHMKDRDMYRAIVGVFNRNEPRPVQADTLRKWVESKTNLLITHMNRLHQAVVYDSENVMDLLALFFKEEDERDQA